jgi:hypothetical protein
MSLIAWPACCQRAYERAFYRWLRENYAEMNATMSGTVNAELHRLLPEIEHLFDECRIVVRVVNRPGLFNAHLLTEECEHNHIVHIVFVSSNLLFFVWRLFMIIGSAGLEVAETEGKMRFRFRTPNEQDVAQLKITFKNYLAAKPLDQEGLDDLVARFEKGPQRCRTLIVDLAALAELFIVLHEVGHVLPAPRLREGIQLDQLPLHPNRAEAWRSEILADLSAAEYLLIGYAAGAGEMATVGKKDVPGSMQDAELESGIQEDQPDKDGHLENIRAFAFEMVASAITEVYIAQWFAERAQAKLRQKPLTSLVDPEYATHPPVHMRMSFFEQWIKQRAAHSHTPFTGAQTTMIDVWLTELAALVFEVPDGTAESHSG